MYAISHRWVGGLSLKHLKDKNCTSLDTSFMVYEAYMVLISYSGFS